MSTKVTVSGWVGTQPRHVVSENGISFTTFRLGSTKRFFDRATDAWVDGATTWFTIKTWRQTAVNVAESVRRSDPVLVHGTLTSETWESPEGPRTSLVVEADSLGPDLARGQATFRHTVHPRGSGPDSAGAEPEGLRREGAATPTDDPWAVPAPPDSGDAEHGTGAERGTDVEHSGDAEHGSADGPASGDVLVPA